MLMQQLGSNISEFHFESRSSANQKPSALANFLKGTDLAEKVQAVAQKGGKVEEVRPGTAANGAKISENP